MVKGFWRYTTLFSIALSCLLDLSRPSLVVAHPELPPALALLTDREVEPTAHSARALNESIPDIVSALFGDDVTAFIGVTPSFLIADSPLPNAYARPDGTIVLTSTLLNILESRDELAFIIAHESGHLMLHQEAGTRLLGHSHRLLGNLRTSPITRVQMELEADEFAVVLMRRSGLAAGSAVAFLERLGRWGSDSHMPLSQIRPPLQTRLARLRELTGN